MLGSGNALLLYNDRLDHNGQESNYAGKNRICARPAVKRGKARRVRRSNEKIGDDQRGAGYPDRS